jgi:hypothetical protein
MHASENFNYDCNYNCFDTTDTTNTTGTRAFTPTTWLVVAMNLLVKVVSFVSVVFKPLQFS